MTRPAAAILLAAFVAALAACSGASDPTLGDDPPAGEPTGADGGSTTKADARAPTSPAPAADAGTASFGADAVTRARQWVAAKVPYCGGPNGGHDAICGGTCSRTGSADEPQWNPYRSDCSGLVSWAWDLPAPGAVTSGLAPYETSSSHTVNGIDLVPGDALNNETHVMLFAGWTDGKGAATGTREAEVIEESDCGLVALDKTVSLTVDETNTVAINDTTGRTFHSIRVGSKPD